MADNQFNIETDEQETVDMAVKALQDAQEEARQSRHPVVFSKDGKLWLRDADGQVTLIKKLPSRIRVSKGIKRAKS